MAFFAIMIWHEMVTNWIISCQMHEMVTMVTNDNPLVGFFQKIEIIYLTTIHNNVTDQK